MVFFKLSVLYIGALSLELNGGLPIMSKEPQKYEREKYNNLFSKKPRKHPANIFTAGGPCGPGFYARSRNSWYVHR